MKFIKLALVTIPRYNIGIFILLFFSSILFYGGGTLNDPSSKGYSFTRNFFSDLGILSDQNLTSFILFAFGLLVCGVTFVIYFYYFMKLFNKSMISDKLGKTGSLFGIAGAIFFIVVGFTPHNYVLDSHVIAVKWAFRCFLSTSILLSFAMFKDKRFENKYAYGYLSFAVMIFFYILILEFGPPPKESDFSLVFNVVSQKIIVLVFILSVLYQSLGNASFISKHLK